MTVREILQDIVEHIRKVNKSKDGPRIPTSDELVRQLSAEYALEPDTIRYYLRVLSDAHYIITIHIVEADERLMIAGTNGYVVAEQSLLDEVRSYSYRILEQTYEAQFYRRKQATLMQSCGTSRCWPSLKMRSPYVEYELDVPAHAQRKMLSRR